MSNEADRDQPIVVTSPIVVTIDVETTPEEAAARLFDLASLHDRVVVAYVMGASMIALPSHDPEDALDQWAAKKDVFEQWQEEMDRRRDGTPTVTQAAATTTSNMHKTPESEFEARFKGELENLTLMEKLEDLDFTDQSAVFDFLCLLEEGYCSRGEVLLGRFLDQGWRPQEALELSREEQIRADAQEWLELQFLEGLIDPGDSPR